MSARFAIQVSDARLLIDLDRHRGFVVAEDAFERGRQWFALRWSVDVPCDRCLYVLPHLLGALRRAGGLLAFTLLPVSDGLAHAIANTHHRCSVSVEIVRTAEDVVGKKTELWNVNMTLAG